MITSDPAAACFGDDADMLLDLGIGFVASTKSTHATSGSPRGPTVSRPAVASPAPSVVDLLSDSDHAPSPTAGDAAASRQSLDQPPLQRSPAQEQGNCRAAAAAAKSPLVDRLLADMVDLLSDDDQDAAPAAALAMEDDTGADAAAGSPRASPPRRKSSSRRIRKPARFKDADAGVTSPMAEQHDDGGADCGPTAWPSPPEDSFVHDEVADSIPGSPCDMPDLLPPPKR